MILDSGLLSAHLNDRVAHAELAAAALTDVGGPLRGRLVINSSHLDLRKIMYLSSVLSRIILLYL